MKELVFGQTEYKERPLALSLGFFDCVHVGHAAIIGAAAKFADAAADGTETAAFTFTNNPYGLIGGRSRAGSGGGESGGAGFAGNGGESGGAGNAGNGGESGGENGGTAGGGKSGGGGGAADGVQDGKKLIFTYEERRGRFAELNVKNLIIKRFDKTFMALTPEAFLDTLFNSFDIRFAACGQDYFFGNSGRGDKDFLREFCRKRGVEFYCAPLVKIGGEKVSSTLVRGLLTRGDVRAANALIGSLYRVCGRVTAGRGEGRKFNTPTINIKPPPEKLKIGAGVYATFTRVGGKKYPSVTYAGAKPTFGVGAFDFETHLLDFSGDLYGEFAEVEFTDFLRGLIKFESAEKLYAQIEKDVKTRRNLL